MSETAICIVIIGGIPCLKSLMPSLYFSGIPHDAKTSLLHEYLVLMMSCPCHDLFVTSKLVWKKRVLPPTLNSQFGLSHFVDPGTFSTTNGLPDAYPNLRALGIKWG